MQQGQYEEEPVCQEHSKSNRIMYKENFCIERNCVYDRACCTKCKILESSKHQNHKMSDYGDFQRQIKEKYDRVQGKMRQKFAQKCQEVTNLCVNARALQESIEKKIDSSFQEQYKILQFVEKHLKEKFLEVQMALQQTKEKFDILRQHAIDTAKKDIDILLQVKDIQGQVLPKMSEEIEKFITNSAAQNELEYDKLKYFKKVIDFYYEQDDDKIMKQNILANRNQDQNQAQICYDLFQKSNWKEYEAFKIILEGNISYRIEYLQNYISKLVQDIDFEVLERIKISPIDNYDLKNIMYQSLFPEEEKNSSQFLKNNKEQYQIAYKDIQLRNTENEYIWTGFLDQQGKPKGFGKIEIENGGETFFIEMENKKQVKQGYGMCKWNDGDMILGLWQNDEPLDIIYKFKDGGKYIGTMQDWNKSGSGQFIFNQGGRYVGTYVNDLRKDGLVYDRKGNVVEIWQNCKQIPIQI